MRKGSAAGRRLVGAGTLVGLCLIITTACKKPEPVAITFYHDAVCDACPDTDTIETIVAVLYSVARSHAHVEVAAYNVFRDTDGFEHLHDDLAARGLSAAAEVMPLLFVGDEVYRGLDAIQTFVDSWDIRARSGR